MIVLRAICKLYLWLSNPSLTLCAETFLFQPPAFAPVVFFIQAELNSLFIFLTHIWHVIYLFRKWPFLIHHWISGHISGKILKTISTFLVWSFFAPSQCFVFVLFFTSENTHKQAETLLARFHIVFNNDTFMHRHDQELCIRFMRKPGICYLQLSNCAFHCQFSKLLHNCVLLY